MPPRPSSSVVSTAKAAAARFLGWWAGELAALIPGGLRGWWRESDRIVLLSFDGGAARFERVAGGGREELFRVESDKAAAERNDTPRRLSRDCGEGYRLMVCLPADRVLCRELTLPLAVEENLRQALSFEIDRYTPFRSEQVYFGFAVKARDPAGKRIVVDLAAAPRTAVDECVAKVAAMGLSADGAVLAEEAVARGADCRNLLPAGAAPAQPRMRLYRRLALSAGAVVALAIFLAIPIYQKRAAAISQLAPLALARTAAAEVDAERDHLRKLVEEFNFLHERKWNAPSTLIVLNELSKLLPDDTYVMQFEMDGTTAQIQGDTGSATSLVEALEASPVFKDVGFKSQLIKLQGTPYDRFHIAAVMEEAARATRPKPAESTAPAAPAPATPTPAPAPPPAAPIPSPAAPVAAGGPPVAPAAQPPATPPAPPRQPPNIAAPPSMPPNAPPSAPPAPAAGKPGGKP